MIRVRHVDGPGRFAHASLDGVSQTGDEHSVSDAAADYLCDDLGHFERVTDEVVLGEDEYEVHDTAESDEVVPPDDADEDATGAVDYDGMTYDELYDAASEADVDGRSSMTKDELIDALTEA